MREEFTRIGSNLDKPRKPHFLFAFYMAGGNVTIFQNLKEVIGRRDDVDSTWLPIDVHPDDFITKIPPISLNGSFRNSAATGSRIHSLQRSGVQFDAAFFFQHTIVTFLYGLRKRIPHLIAMDGTPLWFAENKFWYAHPRFEPGSLMARVKRRITRSVYAGAYRLLPMSYGVKESLINDYNIQEERVDVVPPGIDLAKWNGPDRVALSKNRNGRPLNVIFVGADYLRKGGDLLTAIASAEEFRNVHFHLVTKTFSGKPGPNIFVHSDMTINGNSLIDLYRGADIFVLPTRADTHSLASLEAMAMGLPVITTPVGGIVDIVRDGETGLLIPPDDMHALANRLRLLLGNEGLRLQLGRNGRAHVEQTFNLETNAGRILDLLKDAAASGKN